MVCSRCVMTVTTILQKLNIDFESVLIGEVHRKGALNPQQRKNFKAELEAVGFELIDNHTGGLIEKIKQHIIAKARNEVEAKETKMNLSAFLTSKMNYEYSHLSSLFSSVEGRTIENYFIEQRIEKAKELLVYGQLTLSEIAFQLDYSSTAHLSAQFKKVTGLTPSHFKEIGAAKRQSIDKV
jgi:AraC family transcriptional regulator